MRSMPPFLSAVRSQPIALAPSVQGQVYGLFALAMALTLVGVFVGIQSAAMLLSTGLHFFFLFLELAIVFTAGWWVRSSPLNYVLFAAFPFLSGLTITPYILAILIGYANGGVILLNAFASTVFMGATAAVYVRITPWDHSAIGQALFYALLGLLFMGVLQIFFPALRATGIELVVSGLGIAVFAMFTVFDLQRIERMERAGASPFLLALSLYLDIFNLFLYVLRFMVAIAGERR